MSQSLKHFHNRVATSAQRNPTEFTDSLWRSFALIAVIGVPLSVVRSFNTGWLQVYTVHAVVGLALVIGTFACHKMPLHPKGVLLVLVFLADRFTRCFDFWFCLSRDLVAGVKLCGGLCAL